MNHTRIRGYVDTARVDVTKALAVLSDDLSDPAAPADVCEQVWAALADAHKHLTTALAFVNVDANRQAGR